MTENNLQQEEAMAMLPRPGLLTQDNPTLMGILTLGNKQSVVVASELFCPPRSLSRFGIFGTSKVCTNFLCNWVLVKNVTNGPLHGF